MGRGRQLLQYGSNAGLAQLVGATGAGFEKAGRQMVDLGGNFIQQDNYDNKILLDEKIRTANEKAANDLKNATKSALIAKNSVVNPTVTQAINDKFGVGSEPANNALGMIDLGTPVAKPNITLKEGERVYDSGGKQLIDFPKTAEPQKVSKTIVDASDKVHVVFTDGTTKPTGLSSKDYWASKDGDGNKSKAPAGYVLSSDLPANIMFNSDLYDGLDEAGALMPDKNTGHMYVNKAKYDRYINLANKEIK